MPIVDERKYALTGLSERAEKDILNVNEYELADLLYILEEGLYKQMTQDMMYILYELLFDYSKQVREYKSLYHKVEHLNTRMPEYIGTVELPNWKYVVQPYVPFATHRTSLGLGNTRFYTSMEVGMHKVTEDAYIAFYNYYIQQNTEGFLRDKPYLGDTPEGVMSWIDDMSEALYLSIVTYIDRDIAHDIYTRYRETLFEELRSSNVDMDKLRATITVSNFLSRWVTRKIEKKAGLYKRITYIGEKKGGKH